MEGSLVMENLDSLWFFSNVFSSKTQPIMSLSSEKITDEEDKQKPMKPEVQSHQTESPKTELFLTPNQNVPQKAESFSPKKPIKSTVPDQNVPPKTEAFLSPKKPIKPKVHNQQNVSPKKESLAPNCYELDIVEAFLLQEDEFQKLIRREERSSTRRRTKRKSKRKILGDLELGFDDYGVWDANYKTNTNCGSCCGFGMFGNQQHLVKMPPLSDGMAMKEHLKSWAYAVACTVR